MRAKLKTILSLLYLIVYILFSSLVLASPSASVLEELSNSLVKVETPNSSATGFIWHSSSHAVTSLHVVDGQNTITVSYVNKNGQITATSGAVVEKVLKESDLVLLRIQNPQNNRPLILSPGQPKLKQSLDAIGFPLNIAGYSSTEVKIRFGGNQLRSILPPKVLNKIGDYPSTTVEILNLEGNLVPGLSGAPIVDEAGHVVGIVDGGLEDGAIGICWGIPASHLARLANSTITQMPRSAGIAELFAADLRADVGKTQILGQTKLTKLRSRTFAQLTASADDQLGMSQLATFFSAFNPFSFSYDIYQDIQSGATVVIPEGADIYADGDFTIIDVGDPRMHMKLKIIRVRDQFDAQNQSVFFEHQLTDLDSFSQAGVDPQWSYLTPMTRFGVTINRKGIYRQVYDGYNWLPDKYYFETLATNGDTLLAVAAVNNNSSPQIMQLETMCSQGYNSPECYQIFSSRKIWAQMVLGVQLASFPQMQLR